ncbi:MAG: type II toxin-antitoxin system HigB family toxin [Candidatus Riflebacteria bacterium]|nr:type II toxin-antitoxin system HigB family toxin [Candidatus Riflebacteria bacterium]
MHIISQKKLRDYWHKHPETEFEIRRWYLFARKANWQTSIDVKRVFSSANFLQNNRVVFNLSGNKLRLVVKMIYEKQRIYIRFMGSHTEYDLISAESV